ncbi:MAG: DUF5398 family protein [Chlamydiales bacterium]
MYGLEKKPPGPLEFELEKELKGNPTKIKELMKSADEKIQTIKSTLRQGAQSEEFDKFGVLLHGYAALQRVLNRLATRKK